MLSIQKLNILDYGKEIYIRTDASNIGIGAVIMQKDTKGELAPIQWASKKLTNAETRYGITEKEMLAVVWALQKYEYELKGRKFILQTDHKALERIREKGVFENARVNRWIEKIQQYDFVVEYIKGEEMGLADDLSRGKRLNYETETERGKRMKEDRLQKHVKKVNGQEYWQFNDGKVKKIPREDERKNLCLMTHQKLAHRGVKYVMYEISKEYYWPGVKQTIIDVCRECEICQINNRKSKVPPIYVSSIKPYEKFAIDLMDHEEGEYILVGIDYFTRMVRGSTVQSKKGCEIVNVLKNGLPTELSQKT